MKDTDEYDEDDFEDDEDDGVTPTNAIDKLIESGKLSPSQIEMVKGKASKDKIISMPNSRIGKTEEQEPIKFVKETKSQVKKEQTMKVVNKKRELHIPPSACEVQYHTLGKFSLPTSLHFSDYNALQISDLTMLSEDNALVSLLNAVEENCYEGVDMSKATQEEFYETLIEILKKYRTDTIKMPFICECQLIKPIRKRAYGAIDIVIKDLIKKNVPEQINEPFNMQGEDINGEQYEAEWRMQRVGDVIEVGEYLKQKYNTQQKTIDNLIIQGITKAELEKRKDEEQAKLDNIKIKETTPLMQSYCLVSLNGVLVTDRNRQELFNAIPYSDVEDLFDRIDEHEIGYYKYAECTCPECGETKIRRLLFQFLSLLPTVNAKRSSRKTVFTGI